MKKPFRKISVLIVLFSLFGIQNAASQGYVKLNALYALVGVVNPSVEFAISPKSTLQTDIVVSPWKSINRKHMTFAIFMGEYRRYFKEHNRGWYLGANIGMMAFDMSKPYIEGWKLKFEDRYCKGYGMMIGLCVGYEHQFGERWLLDAFFGWAWMDSHYNGYSFDGKVDMYPPPSGAAGEPRSVQRLVGVVSQQARRLDRLPDFHAQATAHRRFLQQITRIAENGRKRRTNTNALLFEEQGVSSCRLCPDRLRAGKTALRHSERKRRFRNVRLRRFCPFSR